MNSLFERLVDQIVVDASALAEKIANLPDDDLKVEALNRVRSALHEVSPFREEPVDLVLWERSERVRPNDYNPNVVHRPEMQLLQESIAVDHVTQPVVAGAPGANPDAPEKVVVDGEHRYIVCTTVSKIRRRLKGYVPISLVKARTEEEQMASTIRHNRARGVHKLDSMTEIVLSMLRADWSDEDIAKALGMDADEILRMKQVSGAAEVFKRPMYKRAWIFDDGQDTVETP